MQFNGETQVANYDELIRNRRIKIFLSSTFKDMSSERDYLSKNVFMELEANALKRNVVLNLLDLRWGITAEESKQGLVTEICLKEIEASRPFFIGIIGERYGWVPRDTDFNENSSLFESFPWIKKDLEDGLSITEIEIQYGVLRNQLPVNAFFYFKEETAEERTDQSDNKIKLRRLKELIIQQKKYPVKYFQTSEELGELIKKDIQEQIDLIFPKQEELNPIKEANSIQECLFRTKTELYVPIEGTFAYIDNFLNSPQRLLVINGDSGTGKSALLANWIKQQQNDQYYTIYHFIDSASNCDDFEFILVRIYFCICEKLGIESLIGVEEQSYEEVKSKLDILLKNTEQKFVFVLDALNQLSNYKNAFHLMWFPELNQRVKIICSTNNDNYDIINALQYKSAQMYELPLFDDFSSLKKVTNGYLEFYGKKLDDSQITEILGNRVFKNPLMLFSLLEELRLYGDFDTFEEKMLQYVAATSDMDFLNMVFKRLEVDLSPYSPISVGKIFLLLAISRDGVTDIDIANILAIPRIYVASLLHKCHRFISTLGQTYTIAHQILREAIILHYSKDIIDEVLGCYETFLKESIHDMKPNWAYSKAILRLVYLYYQFDKFEKLQELCTSPNAFMILYQFSMNELRRCYMLLSNNGYSIIPLVKRLDEFSLTDENRDEFKPYILSCARHLCQNVHKLDDLSKLLDYSVALYGKEDVDTPGKLDFLCDYLIFCDDTNNYDRGIELADYILEQTKNTDEYTICRAIAYSHKGNMLRKSNIVESIKCFKTSIELYLKKEDNEGAIVAMINAGLGLAQSGDYAEALNMYQKAEYLIDKSMRSNPALIVQLYTCLCNISALYNRIGNHKEQCEYERKSLNCYLQIRCSDFVSLLSPINIVDEQMDLGFNMMRNGKIEEGLVELNEASEKLESCKLDISHHQYLTYKFEILFNIAKGYACNNQYAEAVHAMIKFGNDILTAYNENPNGFSERYLLYLQTMAFLMNDLEYYKTASYYYKTAINEYNLIVQQRKIGIKSYLANILNHYARCLVRSGDNVDALINFTKACDEYNLLLLEDDVYLEAFIDNMIEFFYVTENEKNISDFSYESIKELYDRLYEIVQNNEEYNVYFIFVCIKLIFILYNTDRIADIEVYIHLIYQLLDKDNDSQLSKGLFPFLAICSDKLAYYKFEQQNMRDAIVCSRMALDFFDSTTRQKKHILSIVRTIQHCANYYDEIGHKEEAFKYYDQAISELENVDKEEPNILFLKAGILYDYALSVYTMDLKKAESILLECIGYYHQLYDEKSTVAIQLADAEQALANIYDDMKRLGEAEKYYCSSIYVLEDFIDDPLALGRLGVALNNYGIMLMKQGRYLEAKKILLHSREIRLSEENESQYGVVRTDENLYKLALHEDNNDEAYIYLKEILQIQEKFDIISCGLLDEYINNTDIFAQICIEIDKIEEAKLAYKKVYDLIHKISLSDEITDEMIQNGIVIRNRVNELFNTTDFLNN